MDPNVDLDDEFNDIHAGGSIKTLRWTAKFFKEKYLSGLSDVPSYLVDEIKDWNTSETWVCPRDLMTDGVMTAFLQWSFANGVSLQKNCHTEARRVRFYLQAVLREYEMKPFGQGW